MDKTYTFNHLNRSSKMPTEADMELINLARRNEASPGERVLKNIFNYAKALNVIKTKSSGNFYMISN